jgi:hypothetical protein
MERTPVPPAALVEPLSLGPQAALLVELVCTPTLRRQVSALPALPARSRLLRPTAHLALLVSIRVVICALCAHLEHLPQRDQLLVLAATQLLTATPPRAVSV